MRSGGRGGYLSELINLIGLHAEPGSVAFLFFISKAGTPSLSAAGRRVSHQNRHKRERVSQAVCLSETGNPPRFKDMCIFNLLHSGLLDIYLSL